MAGQQDAAQQFRALHVPGRPLLLFNIWDAGSAAAVAAAGAQALATGSWSVAAAHGLADGERLPLDAAIANLERIVAATELPVTIDLESGYGADPSEVGRTVERALRAGAIGFNIEDGLPQDGTLRDLPDQRARLRAARAAADGAGVPAFVNARTDVFLRSDPAEHDGLVDAALERGRAYAECGADGLFVPGLVAETLIARVVERSPLPVNIMAGADTLSPTRLAELGVARVSYGPHPYLLAMRCLENAAREVLG